MNQPARDPGESDLPANRLTRFSDRAESYARHRPSYPTAAIDAVLEGLGDASGLIAADIGAGTGISSRLLGDRGVKVIAVEPNNAMREAGIANPHPMVTWRNGTGEETGLDNSSVSLVVYAQSFHWVRRAAALTEATRILSRPAVRSRLAIFWNVQDLRDEFTAGYHETILQHSSEPPTSPSFLKNPAAPFPCSGWRELPAQEFDYEQEHDVDGLIGRALSASYSPMQGPGRDRLEAALRDLFSIFARAGSVRIKYRCVVHRASPEFKT